MISLIAAVVLAHCTLSSQQGAFVGTCITPESKEPLTLRLTPSTSEKDGVWDRQRAPSAIYSGDASVNGDSLGFVQLEIYDANLAFLRTPFGWFPITSFVASSSAIAFDLDRHQGIAANSLDRQIVVRASQILSKEAVWDRADTRDCKPNATKWSVYCALEDATAEVTGGNDHRRPALDVVRDLVEAQPKANSYHHLLMDYNNDPATSFADVQKLFASALKWIDKGTPTTP